MTPQALTLDPFTEGDEWEGIPGLQIQIGPTGGPYAAPESPLAIVTMRFKRVGREASAAVELSSETAGEITITDAATWEFSIPPQIVPLLTCGTWTWRIRCKDSTATGKPKTYLADTLEVLETV